MSWAIPLTLGLLPVVAILVWWMFRGGAGSAMPTFANIRLLWADSKGLSDSPAAHRRRVRGILLGLGATLTVCALAQPQWGKVENTSYQQSREVLLALDLSRSMLADDVAPTRLDRAKLLIEALLDQLRGERVGLVVFAGTSFLQSPMSADYEVLRDFLRDLDSTYLPQGGTDYGAMLRTSLRAFGQEGDGDRYLVVLSDGEAHDDQWKSLLPALQSRGIRVISLGVGTEAGALVPDPAGGAMKDENGAAVLSRLEPKTLRELASQTGGTYRDAASWVDIAQVVDSTVAQGHKGRYLEQTSFHLKDRFQWFLAPALVLFLLSYWLEFPIVPVPRLLRRHKRVSAPVRAVAAGAALLVALALPSTSHAAPRVPPSRATVPAPTNAGGAPTDALAHLVDDLANRPALTADDYASLATTTIQLATTPDAIHGEARTGVIDDAIRGVDEGEQTAPQAADWPGLRQQLEALRHEPEPPPQPQQQQPEQQQGAQGSESQDGGQGEEQSAGKGGQQNGSENQDSAKGDEAGESGDGDGQQQASSGDQQNKEQENAGASPDKDEPQPSADGAKQNPASSQARGEQDELRPDPGNADSSSPEQKRDRDAVGEPKPLDDAGAGFGSLDDSQKPDDPSQEREGSRLVGGGPVSNAPDAGDGVAMVESLDRMERIKDGDSPSTLFERMNRADGVPPPQKNGKNW